MTKTQILINELNKLSLNELEEILSALLEQVDRKKVAAQLLDKLIGTGEGVWKKQAQDFVNDLRANMHF
ncbi:MAG: hypothetical protein KDC44_08950 [Phaeodactylibacter sp.]|nr:hypothetical protein [Phaeodactylibacter sp.]